MGGHLARMAETRNVYKILVRKPEGKRPRRRLRRRWNRMEVREVWVIKWIGFI